MNDDQKCLVKGCGIERVKQDAYFCKSCRTKWRNLIDKDIELRKTPDKVLKILEEIINNGFPVEAEVNKNE